MEVKYPDIQVQLIGTDGNAVSIIARVMKALRRANVDDEAVKEFTKQATSGDYDNVLKTCMEWVDVQ